MRPFLEHAEDTIRRLGAVSDIEVTEEVKRSVMALCDVRGFLEKWGVQPTLGSNGQWTGYCPDHVMHDGHPQHLPKWSMNAENGDCYCFTSSRGSNLIYVAKRLYGLRTNEEAIKMLTNGEAIAALPPEFVFDERATEEDAEREQHRLEELSRGAEMVRRLVSRRRLSPECLEYFARDGIVRQSLDALGVCSVESGWLEGRSVIPFLDSDMEICGYVAVCHRGKEWWIRTQYDKLKKADPKTSILSVAANYRKTLYCSGFLSGSHLFGLYEALFADGPRRLDRLVVVEGERDAIKLLQEGVECVAVHGTSIKDEQRTAIKAINPRTLYLGFDMDAAGCKAAVREYERLFSEIECVRCVNFPDGKDPKKFSSPELERLLADADRHTFDNLAARQEILEQSLRGKRTSGDGRGREAALPSRHQ